MGLIEKVLSLVFGSGGTELRQTVEVFRENAEASATREVTLQQQAMSLFASEFERTQKGAFDRFMDGVNRVPRPALALGTLGLFVTAMCDPLWFAARMQGIALVPDPLWWLLGVIVSFYFGARHQLKNQNFQRDLAQTMARLPEVTRTLATLSAQREAQPGVASTGPDADLSVTAMQPGDNDALEHWRSLRRAD